MLPSEFEDAASQSLSPALFEYNGHLPDGTQILAYLFTTPSDAAGRRDDLAAVHEFDADGHHRLVRTRVVGDPADGAVAWRQLHELVAPYLAAGWRAGDIWVRPFLVEIDGWSHGLVFEASGDGLEGEVDEDCQDGREGTVWFRPFGFPFHPPYDAGSYDT
jgi:hypothetical protein